MGCWWILLYRKKLSHCQKVPYSCCWSGLGVSSCTAWPCSDVVWIKRTRQSRNPLFFSLPLLAFLAVANVPRLVSKKNYALALVFSSLTMAFLLMLVAFQLYPVLLPSTIDPQFSVTIYSAASSQKSLGIMLTIVLIGAPLLAGYFLFLYKTFQGKVTLDDTSN